MSILVSAPIRTGKTLYTMKCIFDELNKGRQVFTNIVGIKIDGVISVSSSIDQPFDWRDLPNGSVLVWDEAHEHPAFSSQDLLKDFRIDETEYNHRIEVIQATNLTQTEKKYRIDKIEKEKNRALVRKKEEILDIGRSLLLHGHFGIEIYFITQRVGKLNPDVLASVTTHFVMRRKFGMDAAMIWEFGEAITTWSRSTASFALNKKLWRYPKYLYKFYVSSENHQVRKFFPLKYVAFGCIPLLIFGLALKKATDTTFFGLFPKSKEEQTIQTIPSDQSKNLDPNLPTGEPVEKQTTVNGVTICTPENMNLPECISLNSYNNGQRIQQTEIMSNVIYYNPNDPYQTQPPQSVPLNASDFPRVTNCVKYKNTYYAYDQQGNKMPDVKQSVCKRMIENNERPFNYFQNNNQYQAQQPTNPTEPLLNEATTPPVVTNLSNATNSTIYQ